MKRNAYIGAGIPRLEDARFLRGRGTYVDDLHPQGLVHAVIVRSPVAHGRILRIDADAAREMRGVHAVFTAADIGAVPHIPMRQEPMPELTPFEQPVIAQGKVRYVGEPVAVIVADTRDIAEDAVAIVALDIEELPAVIERGPSSGVTLLFEQTGSNVAAKLSAVKGDAAAAFASHKGYTRRESFRVHRHTAVAMEGRGLLAQWDDARAHMTLHGAAKVPFTNRRILAKFLGLPESGVTLIENDVGGAFGARGEFYPEDFLIPFAARRLNCPVKWIEDRRENLLTTNHAREAECEIKIAVDADGRIIALRGEVWSDIGAYVRTVGVTPARNIISVLSGPYRVPHIDVRVSLLVSNKTPAGTYRGPGRYEADFFRERLFDIVADELGMDRVDFRRRNLIAADEMPYPLATVMPLKIESETDSGDYAATLDRCLVEIGWEEKRALNGKRVNGRYHGLAVGCYFEGGASGPREHARLAVQDDGQIAVFVGSSGVGQGIETAFAQIAADALELPLQRIAGVFHGSTHYVPEGFGSYSSRATVMGGSAIVVAAQNLRDALRTAAAARLGCDTNAVRISEDGIVGPDKYTLTFAEFSGLSADGSFSSNKRTYSYGAHAAHVAVDSETGAVDVLDYVGVEDVGRIVNPKTLHGQTLGAIMQGLGGTLMEHLVYDVNGQLLTASLTDYLIPTACEFPHVHVIATETYPAPHNPLGAKGAGEGGIIPVGGVIANAVAAALRDFHVQPNALPLSSTHVWELLNRRHSDRRSNL